MLGVGNLQEQKGGLLLTPEYEQLSVHTGTSTITPTPTTFPEPTNCQVPVLLTVVVRFTQDPS